MVNNMEYQLNGLNFKLDQAPKNIPVEVYYPDGTLLTVTDNDLVFDYIRNVILDNKAEGFYAIFKDKRYDILPNGRINDWPYGMFDTYQFLLARICCKDLSDCKTSDYFKKTIWDDLEDRNKRIEETYDKA